MSRIPESEWEWFGNAGHFICGRWCRFHLCTKVGPWLVSTVGEYVHPRHSKGNEADEFSDIGCDRKYETMVFLAGERCVATDCGCGLPFIDGSERDMLPANTAKEAAENHVVLCKKYAEIQP